MNEFSIATRLRTYLTRRYDAQAELHFLTKPSTAIMILADNTTVEYDGIYPPSEFCDHLTVNDDIAGWSYEMATKVIVQMYAMDIISTFNEYEQKFDNDNAALMAEIIYDADSEIDFVMGLMDIQTEISAIEMHLGLCNENCESGAVICPLTSPNAEQIIKGFYANENMQT